MADHCPGAGPVGSGPGLLSLSCCPGVGQGSPLWAWLWVSRGMGAGGPYFLSALGGAQGSVCPPASA